MAAASLMLSGTLWCSELLLQTPLAHQIAEALPHVPQALCAYASAHVLLGSPSVHRYQLLLQRCQQRYAALGEGLSSCPRIRVGVTG
jgi:hypothetical protein